MTEYLFAVGMGIVVLVIQTTSIRFLISPEYKPDLVTILVVWSALRIPFFGGLCFAFTIGIFVDLLSGSPTGLFALLYCLTHVVCGQLDASFHIDRPTGRVMLVLGSALAAGLVIVVVRRLQGPVEFGWSALGWILTKAAVTGVVTLLVFPLVERLYTGYSKLARAG